MLGELAQSVRAGVLYASGHRFNPCIPYHTHRGSISQSTPSSIGQSNGLLIRRLQVQLLRGVPLPTHKGSISQRVFGVVAQSVEASDLKSVQSGFESQLPYHHRGWYKSKDMVEVGGIEPPSKQVPHEVLLVESPFHPRTNLI